MKTPSKVQCYEPVTQISRRLSLAKQILLARPAIEHTLGEVAAFYKIPLREMRRERGRGGGQTLFVSRCHMLALFLIRIRTRLSFHVIGGAVRRDHSTVQYAVDRITETLATDAKLHADYVELSRRLNATVDVSSSAA